MDINRIGHSPNLGLATQSSGSTFSSDATLLSPMASLPVQPWQSQQTESNRGSARETYEGSSSWPADGSGQGRGLALWLRVHQDRDAVAARNSSPKFWRKLAEFCALKRRA